MYYYIFSYFFFQYISIIMLIKFLLICINYLNKIKYFNNAYNIKNKAHDDYDYYDECNYSIEYYNDYYNDCSTTKKIKFDENNLISNKKMLKKNTLNIDQSYHYFNLNKNNNDDYFDDSDDCDDNEDNGYGHYIIIK